MLRPAEVFIDIETIPGPQKPRLEDIPAPGNYKDPSKIQAYKEGKLEEAYRSQALDSMAGELLAIGIAIDDEPAQVEIRGLNGRDTELDLLAWLVNRTKNLSPIMWVGHNVKSFDLQWIWRRCIQTGLYELARKIPRERYSKQIIDTMELWAGPDYRDRTSLSKIAKFLSLDGKPEGMDGSKVYDAYIAGDLKSIAAYCAHDVDLTRKIFRQIEGL